MTQNFRHTTLESVTHTHPQIYSPPSRHVRPETVREERHPNYKVQESEEFEFGRVFKIPWSENKVDEPKYLCADNNYSNFYTLGNCTKTRRFVIVGVERGACICLPINTYGKQGTLHSGVYPYDHEVIYTEGLPIMFGGERLTKKPIRVSPVSPREKLDAASRLNYAQVYKIEYNVKLVFIGAVHSSSRGQLWKDFIAVNPGGWHTSSESSAYYSGSSHAVRQRAENYNDDDGEDSSYLQIHQPKMGQPYKECDGIVNV